MNPTTHEIPTPAGPKKKIQPRGALPAEYPVVLSYQTIHAIVAARVIPAPATTHETISAGSRDFFEPSSKRIVSKSRHTYAMKAPTKPGPRNVTRPNTMSIDSVGLTPIGLNY